MYDNFVDVYVYTDLKEGENMLEILTCKLGGVSMSGNAIPALTKTIVDVFKIAIPVILIILGLLDLGKAVTSSDEKQMKEAQKTLIKRVVYAVLIFFITSLVQWVFAALVPKGDKDDATSCISCFVSDNRDC